MADERTDVGSTPATYDATDRRGVVAGRYALGERVGSGGIATVYRAEDRASGRVVALKLIAGGDPDGADRILREARTVARLAHPNVVTLLDTGLLPDGGAYLVLDWVDGRSLAGVLRERGGRLGTAEALQVAAAVARALAAAHAMGILHRDVKPENVMVPRRHAGYAFADARLADFGVQGALEAVDAAGRHTTIAGALVGTPAYMAPEQLLAAPQTTATDLFGLGAVLYELLFGTTIARDATGAEVLLRRLRDDVEIPYAPDVPPPLRDLLAELLEREATRRPQSAAAVAARLAAIGHQLEEPPPDPSPAAAAAGAMERVVHTHVAMESSVGMRATDILVDGAPSVARASALWSMLPLLLLAVAALAIATGTVWLVRRVAPLVEGRWLLVGQPLLSAIAGIAIFVAVTRAIDRRRQALLAQSAGIDASVQRALLGGIPLDREGMSRTIATTVEAIIQQCRSLDEQLIGQTIVAIAREYGSDASTPDSRMAALVQIPQQLERLQQRIAARTTPWYVRHEKLLAALVSGTTILGGLTKTAVDLASAAGAPPAP